LKDFGIELLLAQNSAQSEIDVAHIIQNVVVIQLGIELI
jgi:hypothetical protein